MDAEFERRLILSMSRHNSLNSSYTSPIQSPIKASDRYIPLRSSLSASNLNYQYNISPTSSPHKSRSSSPIMSPNKKCKYEQNEIGLSPGVTADKPDFIIYDQLLQNTLLNTNVDSMLKTSDVQNRPKDNFQTVDTISKRSFINEDHSSIFRYSERCENSQSKSDTITTQHFNRSPISNASINLLYSPKKFIRRVPELPYKVLDAPDLQDDFYLNLIDWSSANVLSVALGSCIYLHNAQTNSVQLLCDLSHTALPELNDSQLNINMSDTVTSVNWSDWSNVLAVGTQRGYVHIYDVITRKRIQSVWKHTNRVGVLAWNEWSLCSGSRDRTILEHDIRQQPIIHSFNGHKQEVCGLKWSPDKSILASGGNDNQLFLWTRGRSSQPLHLFNDHTAAVKAIGWSPFHHGLLASGGGAADRHIRFRSSLTCQTTSIHDTGSQVCQLIWSKNSPDELVSTHAVAQNQIVIWKYPTMKALAKLHGHQQRVLYLAMSPDGESIVTGSGDETLRFWNIFPKSKSVRNFDSKLDGVHLMR